MLIPGWDTYIKPYPLLQDSGEVKRIQEPEDEKECCEMLSFGHDVAAVHMNSVSMVTGTRLSQSITPPWVG